MSAIFGLPILSLSRDNPSMSLETKRPTVEAGPKKFSGATFRHLTMALWPWWTTWAQTKMWSEQPE
ncbi:MAG: hypothetical protein CM1200mP14_14890 [Gammaproteobacteria bacterium]|nr:MAG: hypothetical protein CM1200mP14_14890 [Gammaproteobacteria bacterium]